MSPRSKVYAYRSVFADHLGRNLHVAIFDLKADMAGFSHLVSFRNKLIDLTYNWLSRFNKDVYSQSLLTSALALAQHRLCGSLCLAGHFFSSMLSLFFPSAIHD